MVNFGPLTAEICLRVWGTHGNFNGFRVLAALLHGILVVGVTLTLRRWTEGATYIRQGGHHVGHWPTFLVTLCCAMHAWCCCAVATSVRNISCRTWDQFITVCVAWLTWSCCCCSCVVIDDVLLSDVSQALICKTPLSLTNDGAVMYKKPLEAGYTLQSPYL